MGNEGPNGLAKLGAQLAPAQLPPLDEAVRPYLQEGVRLEALMQRMAYRHIRALKVKKQHERNATLLMTERVIATLVEDCKSAVSGVRRRCAIPLLPSYYHEQAY